MSLVLASALLALSLVPGSGAQTFPFDPTANANVAAYWGQNPNQQNLGYYCNNPSVDIFVLVGFIHNLNTSTACTPYNYFLPDGTVAQNRINCSQMAQDIKHCHDQQKIVLLEVGGGYREEPPPQLNGTAPHDLAAALWASFGPNTDLTGKIARPFGDVSVDGFDLAPGLNVDYSDLASSLLTFYGTATGAGTGSSTGMSKTYFLSASPHCAYPDPSLSPAINANSFDFVWPQFYDDPTCSARAAIDQTGTLTFDNWATTSSTNGQSSVNKVFLGLAGSPYVIANASDYINPVEANGLVAAYKDKYAERFGGFMIRDAAAGNETTVRGDSYLHWAKSILLANNNTGHTPPNIPASALTPPPPPPPPAPVQPLNTTANVTNSSAMAHPVAGPSNSTSNQLPRVAPPPPSAGNSSIAQKDPPASSPSHQGLLPVQANASALSGQILFGSAGASASWPSPSASNQLHPVGPGLHPVQAPYALNGTGTSWPGPTASGGVVYTTVITTRYVDVCPTGLTTITTTYTTTVCPTSVTSVASAPSVPSGWVVTSKLCTACKPSPTVVVVTSPLATPAPTASQGFAHTYITTVIATSYVYICPTGFATATGTYTTSYNPHVGPTPAEVPPGWTKIETVCEVCASTPTTVTLIVPAQSPTPGEVNGESSSPGPSAPPGSPNSGSGSGSGSPPGAPHGGSGGSGGGGSGGSKGASPTTTYTSTTTTTPTITVTMFRTGGPAQGSSTPNAGSGNGQNGAAPPAAPTVSASPPASLICTGGEECPQPAGGAGSAAESGPPAAPTGGAGAPSPPPPSSSSSPTSGPPPEAANPLKSVAAKSHGEGTWGMMGFIGVVSLALVFVVVL